MPEPHPRGVLDTSVVVDIEAVDGDQLPPSMAVSAITLAELTAGPHAAPDPDSRAQRQDTLQRAEATFEALPVDEAVARAYGRVYAAMAAKGRKPRGRRGFHLLIAATAVAAGLPLYTRNPRDFEGLEDLLEVVAVEEAA